MFYEGQTEVYVFGSTCKITVERWFSGSVELTLTIGKDKDEIIITLEDPTFIDRLVSSLVSTRRALANPDRGDYHLEEF